MSANLTNRTEQPFEAIADLDTRLFSSRST